MHPDGDHFALGNADPTGEVIVDFRDNFLIDGEGIDLWIFEIGPVVEATEVAISDRRARVDPPA